MSNAKDLEQKFWKSVKSDRTMMLGLAGVDEGHTRPMTGQLAGDKDHGPIWFFTARDASLVKAMGSGHRAVAHFSAKGHDLFATVHGQLVPDNDRARIDELWNPFVAAWYQGGKTDPMLQLIRLDADDGQIWINESSLLAGVKMLFGADPKTEYRDKVAKVDLG